MTKFVDFTTRVGAKKMQVAREAKKQLLSEYSPSTDFYKSIREAIVTQFSAGCLGDPLAYDARTESHAEHFSIIEAGFEEFLANSGWMTKKATWFDPPRALWRSEGLAVRVNPELGVTVKGIPYLVKLYFKDEHLKPSQLSVAFHLMSEALQQSRGPAYHHAVLDVRAGKLHKRRRVAPADMDILLRTEAMAFANALQLLN